MSATCEWLLGTLPRASSTALTLVAEFYATLIFACCGLVAFGFTLCLISGKPYKSTAAVLCSTLTVCFWLVWLITYMHQMYPLINPIREH